MGNSPDAGRSFPQLPIEARAVEAAHERRDRTYDPELADLFAAHGSSWFDRLQKMEPWDAVLDLEPKPHRTLQGAELDDALTVAADFIDLKSPYMAGHSRRCAQLAADAAAPGQDRPGALALGLATARRGRLTRGCTTVRSG